MEFHYVIFSLFVTFSLSLFLLFRKHRPDSNLPPGRLGLPLIGENFAFYSAIQKGCSEKFFFDRGWAEGAIFKTSLLGGPTVVLGGAPGNKFVFSNENTFVTSWYQPGLAKLVFATAQDAHGAAEVKKLRKVLPGILKVEIVRRNVGVMDEVARRHFTAEWDECPGDSVSKARFAKRYTFRVATGIVASLGDPEEIERLEELFYTLAAGTLSIPINLPGTTLNRALKAAQALKKEIVKLIQRRKAELAEGKAGTGQDVLSDMLAARTDDGQSYSEGDIASLIIGIVHSSHVTTSKACISLLKYLKELPRVYEAVYNEQMMIAKSKAEGDVLNWNDLHKMKYSWNVAQEALRIAPPVPGNFRVVINDFNYAGFSVPKGWKVCWSSSTTHKNPAYFPDPEKFDPTRFEGDGPAPQTYVPFGGGPKMCPGKEYARVKILVFMHNLVKHCPCEKMVVD